MPMPSWFYHFYDNNLGTCSWRSGDDLCVDTTRLSDVSFSNLNLCLHLHRTGLDQVIAHLFFLVERSFQEILCFERLVHFVDYFLRFFINFHQKLQNSILHLFNANEQACLPCFDTQRFSPGLLIYQTEFLYFLRSIPKFHYLFYFQITRL